MSTSGGAHTSRAKNDLNRERDVERKSPIIKESAERKDKYLYRPLA